MSKRTTLLATSMLVGVALVSGCKHHPKSTDQGTSAPVTDNTSETYVGGAGQSDQFTAGGANVGNTQNIYYFDFDSTVIKEEDMSRVKAQGDYLAAHSNAKARLEGHTDARGSSEYNMGLGHRRAYSVKQSLEAQGAKENQIDTVSYGDKRPAVEGNTEEAYQMNRRVELAYEQGAPK